jgi:hypothetical protein
MVEGYQTYYFEVLYGGRLSDLLFCGTLRWKAIRLIIWWVLFHRRLSDLLFCGYFMVEGYQTYWFVDTFLIYGGRLGLIILWESTYQLYIYEAKRTMAMK